MHPTADVADGATLGSGTRVWHYAQIRERAIIGTSCVIGKGAYVDHDVSIGDNVKIQNGAAIFHGSTLEDGVFVGPQACLTNDRWPRAINPDGTLKSAADWRVLPIVIKYGASVGAGALILPGVTVGRFALVGAGAVVTRDVPDHHLVVGVPARSIGTVCPAAHRLPENGTLCGECGWRLKSDS